MADVFSARIRRVSNELKGWRHPAALLISSAPGSIRSRDTHYPYRQNSDFYFLTGSMSRDTILLIVAGRKRPLIIAPKPDPVKVVWEGAPLESAEQLARRLGSDLIQSDDLWKVVNSELRGVTELLYQNTPGTNGWNIARRLIETSSHLRGGLPSRFSHADTILEEMRLYKEPGEIKRIREAAAITNHALF